MIGLIASLALCASPVVVNHDAVVRFSTVDHTVSLVDRISSPQKLPSQVRVEVASGAEVSVVGGSVASVVKGSDVGADHDVVVIDRSKDTVTLTTKARIFEPPVQAKGESQRSFQETRGVIDAAGVYLSPSSRWLPVVVDDSGASLVSGSVTVEALPAGWSALCEGTLDASKSKGSTMVWREAKALDGFHLIAGPFSRVSEKRRGVDVMIWLRQTDGKDADDAAALADRYLEVTGQYLEQYETLIGKYPYSKFALVENFWETGYGMPSFTLLGSQVVRFPFILHTSWPHELLHNWWGNGVFVGAGGNWSEGLTAYLADHLDAEQNGKGAEYRRGSLQRFLDFVDVDDKNDFAIKDFGSRDSAASEAVGYGKTMMVFHMVRRQIGDAAFSKGLQLLWSRHAQSRASFDDVAAAFSEASGADLRPFFAAWTTQKGIPTLALREVAADRDASGERHVSVVVEQTQKGEAFPLEVPVVLTTADGRSVSLRVAMKNGAKSGRARVTLPGAAKDGGLARVDVDPFFDVFRRLDPGEVPPSLSRGLGAKKMVMVTPTLASAAEKAAWVDFAHALCPPDDKDPGRCVVVDDQAIGTLPSDAAIWLLGYGSYLRGGTFALVKPFGVRFDDHGFFPPGAWERVLAAKDRLAALKTERIDGGNTALAVVVEHPRNPALAMTFVASPTPAMIPLLAKKIPHYGKYSYLGFTGDEATNNLKGQWATSSSALSLTMPLMTASLSTKEQPALIALPPPFDGDALRQNVVTLAGDAFAGRGKGSEGMTKARSFVTDSLRKMGIKDIVTQCDAADKTVCNVIARLPGTDASLPRVVLGAHLDHLGQAPQTKKSKTSAFFAGADDNASGVAVALELARQLNKTPAARGLDIVFFDGEESGRLGSISYVSGAPAGSLYAMVNLDVVGRLPDDKPMLVLDGDSAGEWVHVARGVGFTTGLRVELAPQGGGASDQQSFIDKGVPAIQLFSGPNLDYHQVSDTADKVTSSSLVKAAVIAREIVAYLRDRREPLTPKSASSSSSASSPPSAPRRAALGSVPDMSFAGPGLRFDDVVAGSGAAAAGLKKGDVMVRFDGAVITDLKSYSDLLKAKAPGDKVHVVVVRDGKEVEADVVLGAR